MIIVVGSGDGGSGFCTFSNWVISLSGNVRAICPRSIFGERLLDWASLLKMDFLEEVF